MDAYDLLGDTVVAKPPAPLPGWQATQRLEDVYDRLWIALEQLGALEPLRLSPDKRTRIASRAAESPMLDTRPRW